MPSALDLLNQYDTVQSVANEIGVRPELVHAVIRQESGGRADARSPKGAMGLMQVMPSTAANPGYGMQPFDASNPDENLQGRRHLSQESSSTTTVVTRAKRSPRITRARATSTAARRRTSPRRSTTSPTSPATLERRQRQHRSRLSIF
jgi:hypothetical protein